jgi:hypothetical protein
MIMDAQLAFSSAQAITTASAASSNITAYDLSGGNTNIGGASGYRFGADLGVSEGFNKAKIVVSFPVAFTTTNSATLNIQFQGSTDSSTWTTYIESGAIAAASLTQGAAWVFDWPRKALGAAMPKYVRMYYTLGTGQMTTGTINANVVLNADGWVGIADQYPANYVVGP